MTQVDPLLQSFCGIAGLTALGWWLSRRWVWGQKLGATMLVLLLGVAVRNGFGQFLIQPFFVVVGLSTPMAGVFSEGLWILGYAAIVVGMHAVVVLVLRRCQVPMAEVLVASQAAIGGPSTALALATGLERGDLAVAGVALGLLGYGLGTYLGVAMAALADGSFLQIAS